MRNNWSMPTSPRSPEKIRNELEILSEWEGRSWTHVTEAEFAEKLTRQTFWEGTVPKREHMAWTGRARFGTIKGFGFAYKDSQGVLKITPAGRQLIKNIRPHEVFLKQYLKWQIPDPQRDGKGYSHFNLFPFVATLKLIRQLEGLTKDEMALFLFTIKRTDEIEAVTRDIRAFRESYEKAETRRQKLEFLQRTLRARSVTSSVYDYADAAVRYFRYSNLLTVREHRLAISRGKEDLVDRILKDLSFTLRPYDDINEFYSYFGNPEVPSLPYESLEELKAMIESLQESKRQLEERLALVTPQPTTLLKEIIVTYDKIVQNKVLDPPTWFEWNTWRAFKALGGALKVQNNFAVDSEGVPLSPAPGNKPDMEIYYTDFVIVGEVTLSTGPRQWAQESEPVPRHVQKIQEQESRKVYGVFVAPTINDSTKHTFFILGKHPEQERPVMIIPLTLDQFKRILELNMQVGGICPIELKSLLHKIETTLWDFPTGSRWVGNFNQIFESWKTELSRKRILSERLLFLYRLFGANRTKEYPLSWLKDEAIRTGIFDNEYDVRQALNIMVNLNLCQKVNNNYMWAPQENFDVTIKRLLQSLYQAG